MSISPEESSIEGCAIISCSDVTPEEIIRNILGVEDLSKSFISKENVKGYLWSIDTKYYTAEANLFAIKEKTLFSPTFAESIRATIFHFDSKKPSSFENVQSWMPFVKDLCSEVQLLVCNNCSEDGDVTALERKTILDWCLKHQFELVELEPLDDSDDETDDIFKETKGYARIIQALHSHSWANLDIKDEPRQTSKRFLDEHHSKENDVENTDVELPSIDRISLVDFATSQNGSQSSNSESTHTEEQEIKIYNAAASSDNVSEEEQWLLNVMGQDDPNGQSFESLFAKFHGMKEKASGLSGSERKKYAEEVAIAFWRALGGDEEEIAGLSD